MPGVKLLLVVTGNIGGIVGLTSLSLKDWDPSYVWRVSAKNKFPLFTCSQRPKSENKTRNEQWINSDLLVYLTFKESISKVTQGAELELKGEGSYTKGRGKNVIERARYKEENLHENIDVGSGRAQSRFLLTVNKLTTKLTTNNRLGEAGGGDDAYKYGDMVMCNKSLFAFEKYTMGGGSTPNSEEEVGLYGVKFSLDNCEYKPANKRFGCSIKIDSGDKGLKWSDEFQPIVIQ